MRVFVRRLRARRLAGMRFRGVLGGVGAASVGLRTLNLRARRMLRAVLMGSRWVVIGVRCGSLSGGGSGSLIRTRSRLSLVLLMRGGTRG